MDCQSSMCNDFAFSWKGSTTTVNYRGHCKLDNANSSFVSNSLRGELKFYLFITLHFQEFCTNLDLKQEY